MSGHWLCDWCGAGYLTPVTLGDERHAQEHGWWSCPCGGRCHERSSPHVERLQHELRAERARRREAEAEVRRLQETTRILAVARSESDPGAHRCLEEETRG